jgi:serine/threonine-protein kinase
VAAPGYRYPIAPPTPTRPGDAGGNRQLLIMLAVVLGVLVLLCAGVISYLLSRNGNAGASNQSARMVTAVLQNPSGHWAPAGAPYRRVERHDLMSEGRQTR